MRLVYHLPLSPLCRKVRLVLAEKRLAFGLSSDRLEPEELFKLNPSGLLPVLVESNGEKIVESNAIVEFLEEIEPDPPMIPGDAYLRAEVRRMAAWFDTKFMSEVSGPIVYEKLDKRVMRLGQPDMSVIRRSLDSLRGHLDYLGDLIERRRWLAGDELSVADLAAAAHISCLDYFGDVPWSQHPRAKEWYQRIKSRPSFRPLMADHLPGIPPPRHYADLDF